MPRGGPRCVAANCGKTNAAGVSIHCFPKDPALRKQWIAFVKTKRVWTGPSRYSVLCSSHFSEDCFPFEVRFMKEQMGTLRKVFLNKDAVPTVHSKIFEHESPAVTSSRTPKLEMLSKSEKPVFQISPPKRMRRGYAKREVARIIAENEKTDLPHGLEKSVHNYDEKGSLDIDGPTNIHNQDGLNGNAKHAATATVSTSFLVKPEQVSKYYPVRTKGTEERKAKVKMVKKGCQTLPKALNKPFMKGTLQLIRPDYFEEARQPVHIMDDLYDCSPSPMKNNLSEATYEQPSSPLSDGWPTEHDHHHKDTEYLQMDCETVVDDMETADLAHQNTSQSTSQSSESRVKRPSQMEKTQHARLADFQTIYGLPVNRPFKLRYSSATLNEIVDSKVYLILEKSEDIHNHTKPVVIEVKGPVNEIPSTPINSELVQELRNTLYCDTQRLVDITNTLKNSVPQKVEVSSFDLDNSQSKGCGSIDAFCEEIEETEKRFDDSESSDTVSDGDENCEKTYVNVNETMKDVESSFDLENSQSKGCSRNNAFLEEIEETEKGLEIEETVSGLDIVTNILDGVIDAVVKQYEVHLDRDTSNSTSRNKKRYGDDVLYNTRKKRRLLMLEDTADKDTPYSSRTRSSGYRIDYSQFDELDSESSDTVSNDDENSGETYVNGNETMKDVESLSGQSDHAKEEDPDFIPEDSNKDVSNDPDNSLDTDHNDLSDDDIEEEKRKKMLKARENKKLKKLADKQKRIKVQLGEHTDKYYTENQVSVEMKDRGKKDDEKTFKLLVCRLCEKFRTENKLMMENHLELHLNGDLTCKKCDFIGISTRELALHKLQHTKYSANYKRCFICREKLPSKLECRNHLSTVHGLLPWLCTVCSTKENPVTFEDKKTYENHFTESHHDHMLQCATCGRYFIYKQSLQIHTCPGKEKEKAACDICGKMIRPHAIPLHKQKVHFNVRPYPCPQCKYASKTPYGIACHIKAKHEGIHDFKCDQCDFTCTRSFQLTSHKRTHTGYKPYKCDQCPYTAAWNVQLKDHKKLHGSPLGIECDKCWIIVRKGAPFTRHMKKEHSDGQSDGTPETAKKTQPFKRECEEKADLNEF